jgi:diguanylate cyclase (GGDEF)-like protein/PAS domain S-box-containing protein
LAERILILDDEASILDILTQHLSTEGYDCRSTTSPREALEWLKLEPCSLLITDLKMPEMSGIEVVGHAKAIQPDMAVVVVTALIEVTSAVQAIRAGADDYLLKPFNLSEISFSVGNVLEKRRLTLENREYQHRLEERVQDATRHLQRANDELRTAKDYLESLLHSTVDAIFTINEAGHVGFVNQGALALLGYSQDELGDAEAARLFAGGPSELAYLRRRMQEGKPVQNYETELRHSESQLIPVNVSLSQIHDQHDGGLSILAICKDVTEQKRLQEELREMSIKDSLTGLYNQRYFYDRIESEIERARRQNHPLALVLFDVDQFKVYNDTHGHLEGDRVLQEVGRVIVECTREHVDTGFRYGGDEFTVILPEASEQQALLIAERIRTSFEAQHFDHLTLSMGLMSYKEGYSSRVFMQFADSIMYDAKRSGGNRVYVYKPDEHTTDTGQLTTDN